MAGALRLDSAHVSRALSICTLLAACSFQGPSSGGESLDASLIDGDQAVDAPPNNPGFALQFDGNNDLVELTNQVEADFTLEAWIKTTASADTGAWWDGTGVIFGDTAFINDDFGLVLLGTKAGFGTGNPDVGASSGSDVNGGDWVHIAGTRDRSSGQIRIFVNGVQEASATGNTRTLDDPQVLQVGNGVVFGDAFTGTIDEVRIWNIARSGADIAATMTRSLAGDEPGLVGYWRFDDGSGMTAADSSPSANDGRLGAGNGDQAPTWVVSDSPVL